jgi:hypothetical protein
MDVTLVAYYGEKQSPLKEFLEATQEQLSQNLGNAFKPYEAFQVHATVIGLEGTRVGNVILNTNYLQRRQQLKPMNLRKVLEMLKDRSLLPLTVRVAGYKDGELYPFTSRGLHPYLRSFSLQGDMAVAMGWPLEGKRHPLSLDRLRRKLSEANVLHKYHGSPDDMDNDFFFVLGRVEINKLNDISIQSVQESIRSFLAAHEPLDVRLDREQLAIVAYTDTKLPLDTSRVFKLDRAENQIDEIANLYPELAA